jgi:hypothetical protein
MTLLKRIKDFLFPGIQVLDMQEEYKNIYASYKKQLNEMTIHYKKRVEKIKKNPQYSPGEKAILLKMEYQEHSKRYSKLHTILMKYSLYN